MGQHKRYYGALALAASLGKQDVCKLLLEARADPNFLPEGHKSYPLCAAAEAGRVETVRMMLDWRADVDQGKNPVGPKNALDMAVFWGHLPVVKILHDAGADM